jgi:rhamnosyltransferase
VRPLRRIPAVVFAGDARVWRAAFLTAVPLVLLIAFYCLQPRDYYTGTDSVEAYTYIAETPTGAPMCVPGLHIPAGTGRLRLQLISRTRVRPALNLSLTLGGPSAGTIHSELSPTTVGASQISAAVFTIPPLPAHPAERPASLCVTAADVVNWGGTPLPIPPSSSLPTLRGAPVSGRIAVWYEPRAGAQRSYLSRAAEILRRASLFRAGFVRSWLYILILLVLLPALALAAVRTLALTAAGRAPRGLAAWLFFIAALNFACWALITPSFQAPDEVDHFAYTQSLIERGQAPSRNPGSPLPRWSSSENLALEDMSFLTDHQLGDTRPPWRSSQEGYYKAQVARLHPRASDGGGTETAATHGPIYYTALAPAYIAASSSPFSQLTLMRMTSALIGALTVLFTFLLARELAPRRPWLAVLAALLVAYEPMYGFISGAVNNDVGVNAGAAALELLLIRMLRRGVRFRWGLLTGALLILLPIVKGTAYSLYPVAAIAFLLALLRHHRRSDAAGWGGLAIGAVVVGGLSSRLRGVFEAPQGTGLGRGSAVSVTGGSLEHPLGYLAYMWEVFLPRLSFMAPHFENTGWPAFVIFVERGWGAFGWYDVFFPQWVYDVILAAMLIVPVLAVVAARREWGFVRRCLPEAAILLLMPIAVVAGFEAAFYTTGARLFIPEFGRYAFPAIAPLAVLVVASLHAFGRRWALLAGAGLLAAMRATRDADRVLCVIRGELTAMHQPEPTVAIPSRDGGELLAHTLAALAKQTVEHELLVCDSGSTDGSVAAARGHGARVLEIAPNTFTHGGARNLLMREARGTHVALLTQDAEPVDEYWLERLLAGFDLAEDVAIVYGPYRPRPDAPFPVGLELERWFTSLSPDGDAHVERLAGHERSLAAVELIGRRGFFTDANACLARAAWERVPFREVPYAEDRVLAIDMLRAGYAKAFVPEAAVLHSHHYTAVQELRRCFDEWRGLREVYGWREPASPVYLMRQLRGTMGQARRELTREGFSPGRRRATLVATGRHHVVRLAGALLGSRADLLPPTVRRRLSLERRAGFAALDLDSPADPSPAQDHTP